MKEFKTEYELERIIEFTKSTLAKAGFSKVIVGLSGGIDSALTAAVCVKALGSENVLGVMMPYKSSHPDSFAHAKLLAEAFGISYQTVDISPMVDSYFDNYDPQADPLRKGNMMARARMCTLFDLSAKYRALVAGTSNKSELYVGYCTQYGDSACAFEPIGHLYKTEVRILSKYLNVPQEILDKKPTADLWDGQTDEEELGITYAELDEILYNKLDLNKSDLEMIEIGLLPQHIESVNKKIKASAFKRKLPEALEAVWE